MPAAPLRTFEVPPVRIFVILARNDMEDIHLSREILRAVADGTLPRSFLEEIKTEHLLNRCPHCRKEVQAYEAEQRGGASMIQRVLQILGALLGRLAAPTSREQTRAEQDLEELLSLTQEERERRIERARGRFRGASLIKLLLAESRRRTSGNKAEAYDLAALALRVVNRSPQIPGYFDLYALAAAHMANACRVGNDRRKANELFSLARQALIEHGVTDPGVVARVDDLLGSLRKDQRRLDAAERLLQRAARLYSLVHAPEDAARALIKLATVYGHQNKPGRAIETTCSALSLLRKDSDLDLLIAGHYNLALQLLQAGRLDEAADLLELDEDLYQQAQEPSLHLRLLWLRGDIAAGRGDLGTAEHAYVETRSGFVSLGLSYDAAIVSLDLAVLYLRQGRSDDVRRLAEEMLPIFGAQDVHREALAALVLFREAAQQDQLTVEKALQMMAYLREARSEPGLSFGWKRESEQWVGDCLGGVPKPGYKKR
jgi:tetratricopeptide (TPR) repeat protein